MSETVPNNLLVPHPGATDRLNAIPQDRAHKFVRSKDRCHILSRTPIYDKKCNLLAYKFRYTAGENSFRPDQQEKKHVKHILIGFYIRRHIDQFTQDNGFAMTELPLSSEITKFSKALPANRFILHLQDRQNSAASYQHQVNVLKREAMAIAADVYTIVYTNWFREIRSITYAVIDMTGDVEEQFILVRTVQKKAPWIKVICDRCDNLNLASIAFEAGADYVCCPYIAKDLIKPKFNPNHYKVNKSAYDKLLAVVMELLEARPNYDRFLDIISSRNDIKSMIPSLLELLQRDRIADYIYTDIDNSLYDIDSDVLHKLICIVFLMMIEEYYREKTNGYKFLRFEPVKQIILRASFVDELLKYKTEEVDPSWGFSVGVCSLISTMYVYTGKVTAELINQINSRLMVIIQENPLIDTALNVAKHMEESDLEYVDGVIASNQWSRHDILFAYENAVCFTADLVDMISQKRF
ncbi:MAG: hypothetical protein ACI4ND_05965 [Succinivibrio sp.]